MIFTGKTSFLYMLLIKRLLGRQPTFFQTSGGSVYYVADVVSRVEDPKKELTFHDDLQDPFDTVALVDADGSEDQNAPCPVLLCSPNIRIIMASSPRGATSKNWLKQLNVPDPLQMRMMDIWSEAELVITA
jgi:hypothetical protein